MITYAYQLVQLLEEDWEIPVKTNQPIDPGGEANDKLYHISNLAEPRFELILTEVMQIIYQG